MLAEGNGDPLVCVRNLLQLKAGEVPYDRTRGIDPEIIDKPSVETGYLAEVEVMLEEFEPRVELDTSEIGELNGSGDILANITLTETDEDEEEEDE